MHRLLVVQLAQYEAHKFRVVGDSSRPDVSEENPISIEAAGGSGWAEFDDSRGYSSPYAVVPCEARVADLGYWHINKTGKVLDYDFAAAGLSERKVVTSGELHVEYAGRRYVARAGDSMLFLTDPTDTASETLRPFSVRFFGDSECTVVYTEYLLS